MPSKTEGGSSTARERLLEAGTALLATSDGGALFRSLTAVNVSAAARLSRRTFYDQFPTATHYTAALTQHLAALDAAASDVPPRAPLDAADGDVRRAVASLVHSGLERRRIGRPGRAAFIARVLDAGSSKALATPSAWVPLVQSLLDLGVTPRNLFTPEEVARALEIVADGFSLGEAGITDIAVNVLLTVLMTMTTTRGHDLEASATDTFERRVFSAWRERVVNQPVRNIHRLVLHVASEEIAANGFQRLSLAVLSDRTGLSEAMIGKYVGTTRDIGDAILAEFYPGLAIALEGELATAMPAEQILSAHVVRVVTLSRTHPEFAEIELALRSARPVVRTQSGPQMHLDELLARLLPRASSDSAHQLVGIVQQLSCTLARELPSCRPESCAQMVCAMSGANDTSQTTA